jgi:hypothetical protein
MGAAARRRTLESSSFAPPRDPRGHPPHKPWRG